MDNALKSLSTFSVTRYVGKKKFIVLVPADDAVHRVSHCLREEQGQPHPDQSADRFALCKR